MLIIDLSIRCLLFHSTADKKEVESFAVLSSETQIVGQQQISTSYSFLLCHRFDARFWRTRISWVVKSRKSLAKQTNEAFSFWGLCELLGSAFFQGYFQQICFHFSFLARFPAFLSLRRYWRCCVLDENVLQTYWRLGNIAQAMTHVDNWLLHDQQLVWVTLVVVSARSKRFLIKNPRTESWKLSFVSLRARLIIVIRI